MNKIESVSSALSVSVYTITAQCTDDALTYCHSLTNIYPDQLIRTQIIAYETSTKESEYKSETKDLVA